MDNDMRSAARRESLRAVRLIANAARIMGNLEMLGADVLTVKERKLITKHTQSLVRIGLDLSHPDHIYPTLF